MWAIPVSVIEKDVRFYVRAEVDVCSRYDNHRRRCGKYKGRETYSDIYPHSRNSAARKA